jgi:hypothetical protein
MDSDLPFGIFKLFSLEQIYDRQHELIHTEYYMSKSVSHAVSTREPYITPRFTSPRGDIRLGLMRNVIQILTWNVNYII